MKKKVFFAINNLGMGGAENMLIEQVRYLDKSKFEPFVGTLLRNPEKNVLDKLLNDVELTTFDFRSIFSLVALYKVWSYLRRGKFDAIITNLFDTNLLARVGAILARVPIILSYEHNVLENKKKWQIIVDRFLARFTKKILVGSNEVLEFTSKQERLPRDKFQLNFNSVPLRLGEIKKKRDEFLRKHDLPIDLIHIVTVGSFTEQKEHKYLVDAVHEMKSKGQRGFKVLIYGKGQLKDELLKQIHNLNLEGEIKLMGIGPIEEIMAMSDIFTLPSLWEGLSIALLNAMDAGCPIVATRVSGTNEALENEVSALLVESGKSSELGSALERLLDDGALRQRLAKEAKRGVERFSIEKNVKVIEDLIISG